VIDGSIVMAGAVVGPNAKVVRSVLGVDSRVGDGAELSGAVLADRASVGPGERVAPGTRVEASP
jgi:NDP-sugar pyrophosphorylase family protein